MINNVIKMEKAVLLTAISLFFAGVLAGALYMAFSITDDGLYTYLSQIFEGIAAGGSRFEIFKNSLADNLKLFLILTVCGFCRIGIVGSIGCCGVKGFISGFTTAAFVRYYAARGLLISAASILSTVIFVPVFILFCACSASFSLKKKEKNTVAFFLVFALICLTIFCAVSFLDGYVTTTFMKLLRPFVVKV